MASMAKLNIEPDRFHRQVAAAIHCVVHVGRLPDGTRRVMSISEVSGMEGGAICLEDLFVFEPDAPTRDQQQLAGRRQAVRQVGRRRRRSQSWCLAAEASADYPLEKRTRYRREAEVDSKNVHRIVVAIAKDAGLPCVSPHDLRRAVATHMADNGATHAVISRLLGHAKVSTTEICIADSSPDQLKKADARARFLM